MPLYKEFVKEVWNEKGELVSFASNVPESYNFAYDVVDRLAAEQPDKTAVVWCNPAGEEKILSFGQIKDLSDRFAAALLARGVKKGDMVMLILKRHYEFWIAIVALHKLGAVTIPATHLLTVKDLEYRFTAASVDVVVCTGDGEVASFVDEAEKETGALSLKIMARGKRDGWLDFDRLIEEAPAFDRAALEPTKTGELMLMYFTSGTTGMPKMVAHDFEYPVGHILTGAYWHNCDPGGLHFTMADTGWGKAIWGKLYGQWMAETAVFVYDYDKFEPDHCLALFKKYGITSFCAPPTIFRFFIKEDLSKYDLSSLQYVTIAGEALNPEVFKQFYDATGLKLMEGFGQTETTLTVCTLPWMSPKPGSMGRPSPLYEVDLVDENGESVATGVVGEIVVRATPDKKPAGLFMGYYRDPERTEAAWHDGLYHTGDVAWKDEDGYYWYVGRTDDIIKSSGYRIGPFEVESVIMEHPAVLECAVTGVPDPIRGQVVKATVVLTKGRTACDELAHELQEYVKKHTAPYKYPRIVEFVDQLPKTISGKIKRTDIRKKTADGSHGGK